MQATHRSRSASRAARAGLAATLLLGLVASCEPVAPAAPARPPAGPSPHGDSATLLRAADASIGALESRQAGSPPAAARASAVRIDALRALHEAIVAASASKRPTGELSGTVAQTFAADSANQVLVTGYYEPILSARRTRAGEFRYPIYRPPAAAAATAGRQLPARKEIEAGALADRGLEIFWVSDPIELFFLHVQGSGRLVLADGSQVRVSYAANNGWPYRSIGAVLVERGAFASPEDATAPAIKAWLRVHPDEAAAILRLNPRYVFFREVVAGGDDGPRGSLGAPLVAWRSVAVDPAVTPLGSIGLLEILLPGGEQLRQIVIAMDTGAAIRGPGRLDLFLGHGSEADAIAGILRARGTISWLRLRPTE